MILVIIAILSIIALIIVFVSPIFLVAYISSQSRKNKRKIILKSISGDIDFYAAVRINSSKQNAAFLKFVAFECSGILYVQGNKAYFKGTKKKYELLEFNLSDIQINWIGIQAQNGALQWFSVFNGTETYYFNVDTGMTIFKLSKSGDTTKGVYNKLIDAQSLINIGNIGNR